MRNLYNIICVMCTCVSVLYIPSIHQQQHQKMKIKKKKIFIVVWSYEDIQTFHYTHNLNYSRTFYIAATVDSCSKGTFHFHPISTSSGPLSPSMFRFILFEFITAGGVHNITMSMYWFVNV